MNKFWLDFSLRWALWDILYFHNLLVTETSGKITQEYELPSSL